MIHPLKFPELSSLSVRCEKIIDENIQNLNYLLHELENRNNENIRDIIRGFRNCTRQIELVESFGISALYHQTPGVGYLNKIIFQIHNEINLPINHPSVACISTSYYYYHPFTEVIFVPLGESEFLLHLPDVFHEIGHAVLSKKEDVLRLKTLNEKYIQIVNVITEHYRKILIEKSRESGPKEIPLIIQHIHQQWKYSWINEFLSDLFALYTLGPAFASAHLHLVTKKSKNVYEFSPKLRQEHPSDDSRMKMLITGLNFLGFTQEAKDIKSKWEAMPFVATLGPVPEYHYAYPDELMEDIALLFLDGLRESGFQIVNPTKLANLSDQSIIKLLNDAWAFFWKNPTEFRKWEEERIKELKKRLLSNS
jgi:hypothetical protein